MRVDLHIFHSCSLCLSHTRAHTHSHTRTHIHSPYSMTNSKWFPWGVKIESFISFTLGYALVCSVHNLCNRTQRSQIKNPFESRKSSRCGKRTFVSVFQKRQRDNGTIHITPHSETTEVMYVWRNTVARSCNHTCSGKAITITYPQCVCL